MTDTKPTIEEQIEAQKEIIAIHENEEWHQDEIEMDKSILASLEKLAALEKPVQKKQCRATLTNGSWNCDCKFKHPIPCAKNAESQPVPVEPAFDYAAFKKHAEETHALSTSFSTHLLKAVVDYIDSLQSALKLAQEERDAKDRLITNYEEWLSVSGENAKELQERAEKAEAINRRMVERMKEPSANMKSAGYGKPDYLAIFKAMSAELLKEVEK